MHDSAGTIIDVLSMGFNNTRKWNKMKFKENLTIIEQKDIIADIAAETDIEKQAIENIL